MVELSRHPFIYVPGDNDWTDCRHNEVFASPSVNWVRIRVDDSDGRPRFEVTPGS